MKINLSNTQNINNIAIKLLEAAIDLLNSIEYDTIEVDGIANWEPCYVRGMFDPDFAWAERSRAQGMIYAIMEGLGKPLYGWNQFDSFVWCLENGTYFDGAYATAQCATPQYRIKEILGGDGSKENPFVFKF